MKIIILGIAALVLCSCEDHSQETYWTLEHKPTTPEEHKAVAEQVRAIMAATPSSLAGNDQDWDDAINMATFSANHSICKPTLWERIGYGRFTGKWKQVEEIK